MKRGRDFSVSAHATTDLFAIHAYIARDNPQAADRFFSSVSEKIAWIAASGFHGLPREKLMRGLRAALFGNYVIYFAVENDHVRIMRIMHGARHIGPHDFVDDG